jgi:hypothetical protein
VNRIDIKLEKLLVALVMGCPTCGYPRDEFLLKATSLGHTHPLIEIKDLTDIGFVRFDEPDEKREIGVFKPLPPAYEYLTSRGYNVVRI